MTRSAPPVARPGPWLSGVLLAVAALLASCGGGASTPGDATTCDVTTLRTAPGRPCLRPEAVARLREVYSLYAADGTLTHARGGFDPGYYPTELLASVAAVWAETGDPALGNWAQQQLAGLRDRLRASGGFLIWPDRVGGEPTFGPNPQGRLLLSLLLLRASGSALDRSTLDELIGLSHAALERLTPVEVGSSVTGRRYLLPPYAFHNTASPQAITGRTVDPNQDAALAAAYAMYAVWRTASDPASAQSATAKARQYAASATDLMRPLACTPLADQPEFRGVCDTRYNSFHLAMLTLYARASGDGSVWPLIADQYALLRSRWLAGLTDRTYPAPLVGKMPDPVELMVLLPTIAKLAPADLPAALAAVESVYRESDARGWPMGWLLPQDFFSAALGPVTR